VNFTAIPPGAKVFVDANILIYAFSSDPTFGAASLELMERIERGEVGGFISASLLSDVAHRLMTLEACQTFGWSYTGIARRLRRSQAQVRQLHTFRRALGDIDNALTVLEVTSTDVLRAGELSQRDGLLSGDALMIAIMEKHQLTLLASNDLDFDQIPGISRYSPL
jgi:predicted nucleic acid-binding protein